MLYVSTRGAREVPLSTALELGLASDGGLFVPATPVQAWAGSPQDSPVGGAAQVDPSSSRLSERLSSFLSADWSRDRVEALVRDTLSFPTPLVELEPGIFLLELFHGPSAAFKDVGARFLARALAPVALGGGSRTVLVATSGDTGGAVAAAFDGVPGTRVVVLYPEQGVTELQRRQFTTLGDNVVALAVPGPFDDCQRLVKEALASPDLGARFGLTSANSINIGRLLPQMLYYWIARDELRRRCAGAPATFIVPSGNLGNLTAGLMAAAADMPESSFIAALNRNDTLARWLEHRSVAADRVTVRTPSSAMDVAQPSNLERLQWFARVQPSVVESLAGTHVIDDEATFQSLRDTWRHNHRLVCPHTAVGLAAARRARAAGRTGPMVVLGTAHPGKFADVVHLATGITPELPSSLAGLWGAPERFERVSATLRDLEAVLCYA